MMTKKNLITVLELVLFLTISFLYIGPEEEKSAAGEHSSRLKSIITTDGNKERIDYVNEDGRITVAADMRYATVVVTKSENYRLEEFFDEKGTSTSRYSGEWAILREYDEQGNNIRNTSLDVDGNLVLNTSGYAIEERKYNETNQNITVQYYDTEGLPVETRNGYGKINQYDGNGRIDQITCVNPLGEPIINKQGYATKKLVYYETEGPENGKVKEEYFYDTDGNPISLALGQYGVHKEYDEYGRESVLTYLDAEGKPITTTKGYTTILRTFQANNYPETEKYYDLDGNPFSLSEGQYGIKRIGKQTIYLDEKGNELFNFKNFLYNHSRIIIFFALMIILISVYSSREINIILLLTYLLMIVYLTLMYREKENTGIDFHVFRSFQSLFENSEARADIFKNIWLFIPFGAILYRVCPKSAILFVPVGMSILIETIQYFTGTGLCEMADIISNSIGGWIGYCMGELAADLKHCIHNRKKPYYV